MNLEIFIIPAAYILDLLVGDPQWPAHPVRFIGRLIIKLEQKLNIGRANKRKLSGMILVVLVLLSVMFTVWGTLKLAAMIHSVLFYGVSILLVYFSFSVKALAIEANKIKKHLENGNISQAREGLALIVGRETKDLDEPEIIRATVETVAESTMDSIVAPLFYAFLGGPILAWLYKAVNTLDSMVGHKNERFREFGWASAKLDGLLNFIPAKITSFLICVSMFFCGENGLNALKWTLRYLFRGPGVNSDAAEAAMAGGLGVQLGGTNFYDSIAVQKPFIADALEPLSVQHIRESVRVMYIASVLFLIAGLVIVKGGI